MSGPTAWAVAWLGAAAALAAAGPAERRTYLKRAGGKWLEVRRGPRGLEVAGAIPAPAAQTPSGGGSGLFLPFVATPTGSWPEAVAIGDVTGDGRNDVVLVTSFYFDEPNDYKLFVFRQLPGGTLAPPVKLATLGDYVHPPTTVAIGDVNGDARNDVVIGNSGAAMGVFYQNASGGLEDVALHAGVDSTRVRVADLNDDGRYDVVGAGNNTTTVAVWLQEPDGALAAPVVYAAPHGAFVDLEVGDVNRDGLTDVAVSHWSGPVAQSLSVLYQQPGGTLGGLVTRSLSPLPWGIAIGDVSADGRNDVVASHGGNRPNSYVASFLQLSDGTLPATPASLPSYDIPEALAIADLNDDLRQDVLVAHGGWIALGVYLQGPGGSLGTESLDPIPYASHYNPHGLAVGDIDSDGAPDVVIADYNSGLVVLRHVPVAPLPQRYHTVPPCRLVDTRTTARPLEANTYRTFRATEACGVPAEARAVALNVTAVNPGAVGDYRLYPAGGALLPTSSTINFAPGRTRANNAIVSLGPGGEITVRCDMPAGSTASAHLVLDVVGYFRAD